MTERELKGLQIAACSRIVRKGPIWHVPSQSSSVRYAVHVAGMVDSCTCPDHELTGNCCKHIHAVKYVIKRESFPDGRTIVTKTLEVSDVVQPKRPYCPKKAAAWNAAQVGEKDNFLTLLHELCRGIPTIEHTKAGRPRLPMADMVFSSVFKVYSTISTRRFMSDLRHAHDCGYISRLPHHSTVFSYLESPMLTPILRELIIKSSLPLTAIESDFAADSTGFMTSRYTRWFDHKYRGVQEHDWVKCHIMCGVKTNIVTAVEIRDRDASDTKLLPDLVNTTAQNFTLKEVSADRGYGSVSNVEAIAAVGATPYIAFKSIHTGRSGGLWGKMYGYFMYKRDEFLTHYHKRSNVESTFSMMKRKFGDSLRSKTDVAMVNETLCKVLCHNIVVLIHEMHELGIEPTFRNQRQVA